MSRRQRAPVDELPGLWPDLLWKIKQQVEESLSASSACDAACADVYGAAGLFSAVRSISWTPFLLSMHRDIGRI
jgi:hypothetical protein